MRSDWDPAEASWTVRQQGQGWSLDGARQPRVDRSVAPLATASHADDADTEFEIGPEALATLGEWLYSAPEDSRALLSLQVERASPADAAMVFATSDSEGEECGAYAQPRLEIDVCPDSRSR